MRDAQRLQLLARALPVVRGGCFIQPDANGHVVVPEGTTSLPDSAFYQCYELKTIELPASLHTIGESGFSSCSWLEEGGEADLYRPQVVCTTGTRRSIDSDMTLL